MVSERSPDHWMEATPQDTTPEKVRAICDMALAMWSEGVYRR